MQSNYADKGHNGRPYSCVGREYLIGDKGPGFQAQILIVKLDKIWDKKGCDQKGHYDHVVDKDQGQESVLVRTVYNREQPTFDFFTHDISFCWFWKEGRNLMDHALPRFDAFFMLLECGTGKTMVNLVPTPTSLSIPILA